MASSDSVCRIDVPVLYFYVFSFVIDFSVYKKERVLSIVEKESPDLAVQDVMLPDLRGFVL